MSIKYRFAILSALLAIPNVVLGPTPGRAMDYSLAKVDAVRGCKAESAACPYVVVATGPIDENSGEELLAFLTAQKDRKVANLVFINSPGGSLVGSLKLGVLLRALKTSAYVSQVVTREGRTIAASGACVSACVFAMMGAPQRFILPTCVIGVHRARLPGGAGDGVMAVLLGQQRISGNALTVLRRYAKYMGVDPAIVDMSENVSSTTLRILKPAEVVRLHLARLTS
jgi:hypothetical protein